MKPLVDADSGWLHCVRNHSLGDDGGEGRLLGFVRAPLKKSRKLDYIPISWLSEGMILENHSYCAKNLCARFALMDRNGEIR